MLREPKSKKIAIVKADMMQIFFTAYGLSEQKTKKIAAIKKGCDASAGSAQVGMPNGGAGWSPK